jgi:fermentation-respiration switch protein FrsA (DUF1100 family)
VLDTSDGERVIAYTPPRPEQPIVIYFHGNAEVATRAARHRDLIAGGASLVALSYRGYMGSTGRPTEASCCAMPKPPPRGRGTRAPHVRGGMRSRKATSASTRPVAKLILEAPFSSTVDVAASMFPIVPVRWLMLDQFRSDQRIGAVAASILILHGDRDFVVPVSLGERLFELAREPKRLVRYPSGGHDDLDDYGAGAEARRFIAEPAR